MRLTRGGPSMERPAGWTTTLEVETSNGAANARRPDATYGRNEDGGLNIRRRTSIQRTAGAAVGSCRSSPSYVREVGHPAVRRDPAGRSAATYGGRYIFGQLDRSTYAAQVRVNYTFKPDLNLDFYGEPFAASGRYESLGQLAAARTRRLVPVAPELLPTEDFLVRSFRSNLVLRWEWRAGSFFYLVWQQNRAEEETTRERASIGDIFRSLGAARRQLLRREDESLAVAVGRPIPSARAARQAASRSRHPRAGVEHAAGSNGDTGHPVVEPPCRRFEANHPFPRHCARTG